MAANSTSFTSDASMINVNGGANAVGIASTSSGPLNLTNGSSVDVTGGAGGNTFGLDITGNRNVTIDASTLNLTGGSDSFGCNTAGSGAFMVSGSAFNVTGGANSYVCQIAGSGPVSFSSSSLTMNAAMNTPAQSFVGGIHTTAVSSSALTFNDSQINVTGGSSLIGIFSEGSGNVTISGGSAINVTGGGNNDQGFNVSGTGTIGTPILQLLNLNACYYIRSIYKV